MRASPPWLYPYLPAAGLCAALLVAISWLQRRGADARGIELGEIRFATSNAFNIGAALVTAILIVLYWYFW